VTTAVRPPSRVGERVGAVDGGRWALYGLLAVVAVFLGVSTWWVIADSRVFDWDSARHLSNTWAMRNALLDGDILAPVTLDNVNHYPPLLYLVGTIGMAFGGWQSTDSAVLAMNFVFAPLLALGVWGTARIAYGQLAGVLAAVFALGAPMVVSTFHLYMLDVPQASLVAVTVWLLLLSRRFERPGIAAVAGAAGAGAMLLKPTTAIFLAGPVLVILVRGGWRRWRGLAAFLAVGLVLAGPWYLVHLDSVVGLTRGASSEAGTAMAGTAYVTPPRWSVENALWYGWNLLNIQLLAPLFAFFVIGTACAAVRFWRTRDPVDPTPELIVGGLVSYVGVTFITLKDYRYSLSVLVFVAVLATGWAPLLRRPRLRLAAAAVLVAVAAVNLAGVSTGTGDRVTLSFADREPFPLGERTVRVYSPDGYIANRPRDDSDVLEIMKDLRADGFTKLQFEPNGDITFSNSGLALLMTIAGLELPPSWNPARMPRDVPFINRHPLAAAGSREPCGRMSDGWGLYVVRQRDVSAGFPSYRRFYCPGEGASARR
jgi:hypothetical protein